MIIVPMMDVKRIKLLELLDIERALGISFYTRAGNWIADANGKTPVTQMEIVILAKEGSAGDWAAYSGQPYGTKVYDQYLGLGLDLDNPAYVQTNGDKLYFQLAEKLFPQFSAAGLVYRP